MFNVHQHWDPLRVCAVGRSYPPEFYDFISNKKVRNVFYRIAEETEEDYQALIKFLHSFNVEVVRVENFDKDNCMLYNGTYKPPLMCPRDYTAMIGETFYMPTPHNKETLLKILKEGKQYKNIPLDFKNTKNLPNWITDILTNKVNHSTYYEELQPILDIVEKQGNNIEHVFGLFNHDNATPVNTAMISRIGKDLYFGTETHYKVHDRDEFQARASSLFPDYRCHIVDTRGHYDSVFCPVAPGLIVSLYDVKNYEETFPGWEIIYLPDQGYHALQEFTQLREKTRGKWWVPGEELNDDFTDFVETWMNKWVGYVEETVFDVNMLVIDEKNVLCNNYNQKVFDAFAKRGITPHVINFRHRYFWDGGWHCLTSDLHREGVQKDYFPERG